MRDEREDGAGDGGAEQIQAPVTRSGGIPLPVVASGREAPGAAMDRREALKLLALAAAAPAALSSCAPGEEAATEAAGAGQGAAQEGVRGGARSSLEGYVGATNPRARGDAWDPDLVAPVLRWEKVLTEDERAGLAALVDVIIPADDVSPSASAVGAHDFIDEWVSAPYDFARNDLIVIRSGLVWLDQEASRRFGTIKRFRDLGEAEKREICDDICYLPRARPEHRIAARFFDKVRDLTTTAFYTTEEGMADIGYVGNVALSAWGPPPPEVLRHLGLEAEG